MSAMFRSFVGLMVCVGWVGAASLARGQDGPPVPKPTAEHQRLAKDVGTWDATVKYWMRGPDSEPTVSQGVEVVKLMPGGLWSHSEFDGKVGDQEFHGCGANRLRHQEEKICRYLGRHHVNRDHDDGGGLRLRKQHHDVERQGDGPIRQGVRRQIGEQERGR